MKLRELLSLPNGFWIRIAPQCNLYPTTTVHNDVAQGPGLVPWHGRTVHSQSLSATDLRKTPTANFVIKYKSKETEKPLNGNVACELSEQLYGAAVWWVLLDKI